MSIKLFQEREGLVSDGVVGKKTISKMMEVFDIDSQQVCNFLGQIHHETAGFKYHTENLNYSKNGLLKVFGKYFTEETAGIYARDPERIANKVYSNRMGNGDSESGEGWKFRGRGAIQLTGKNNYTAFSKAIGDDSILDNPDIVATKYYLDAAIWYFREHNLFEKACYLNDDVIKSITKAINGGYNGLEDRIDKVNYYYKKVL